MSTEIIESPLPIPAQDILDFAPVPSRPAVWMIVRRDGLLVRFDADAGSASDIGLMPLPQEPDHEPWGHALTPRLYVAPGGRFAAVVNDYGKLGLIYDIDRERVTLELDGGEYHSQTVPFSFCFLEHSGRTLAVHRSDWNRLDVSAAASGALLTERGPTGYRQGEPRPEHYLDYFHGRLLLSPGGSRVADDGWVWHPVGVTKTWDTRPWLEGNVWESEDGRSNLSICAREGYWDHAMCWLDDDHLAVGGIGEDDMNMTAGVRVFSVAEPTNWESENFRGYGGREVATFEGPAGQFFGDGLRLFSTEDTGLVIFSVASRSRVGEVEMFFPSRQHIASRELVELRDSVLRRWHY